MTIFRKLNFQVFQERWEHQEYRDHPIQCHVKKYVAHPQTEQSGVHFVHRDWWWCLVQNTGCYIGLKEKLSCSCCSVIQNLSQGRVVHDWWQPDECMHKHKQMHSNAVNDVVLLVLLIYKDGELNNCSIDMFKYEAICYQRMFKC